MWTIRNYILFLLFAVLASACDKGGCNVVPNVSFNQTFSQATASDAFRPNGSDYVSGGVSGLIVYNISNVAGTYKFVAYDRCSPVNPEQRNQVVISNAFYVEDPASGAKWFLKDGSPIDVAECPLKPYYVSSFGNSYTVGNN